MLRDPRSIGGNRFEVVGRRDLEMISLHLNRTSMGRRILGNCASKLHPFAVVLGGDGGPHANARWPRIDGDFLHDDQAPIRGILIGPLKHPFDIAVDFDAGGALHGLPANGVGC